MQKKVISPPWSKGKYGLACQESVLAFGICVGFSRLRCRKKGAYKLGKLHSVDHRQHYRFILITSTLRSHSLRIQNQNVNWVSPILLTLRICLTLGLRDTNPFFLSLPLWGPGLGEQSRCRCSTGTTLTLAMRNTNAGSRGAAQSLHTDFLDIISLPHQ